MGRPGDPKKFLTPDESQQVAECVAAAERLTSAEIKVVLVRHCWDDIRRKAAALFRKLGLHKTRERNAVLILLVTTNREFGIFGDRGIHEKVGDDFWKDARDRMRGLFAQDLFAAGICEAVRLVGERLTQCFPRRADDRNEIPDEVTHAE